MRDMRDASSEDMMDERVMMDESRLTPLASLTSLASFNAGDVYDK